MNCIYLLLIGERDLRSRDGNFEDVHILARYTIVTIVPNLLRPNFLLLQGSISWLEDALRRFKRQNI